MAKSAGTGDIQQPCLESPEGPSSGSLRPSLRGNESPAYSAEGSWAQARFPLAFLQSIRSQSRAAVPGPPESRFEITTIDGLPTSGWRSDSSMVASCVCQDRCYTSPQDPEGVPAGPGHEVAPV